MDRVVLSPHFSVDHRALLDPVPAVEHARQTIEDRVRMGFSDETESSHMDPENRHAMGGCETAGRQDGSITAECHAEVGVFHLRPSRVNLVGSNDGHLDVALGEPLARQTRAVRHAGTRSAGDDGNMTYRHQVLRLRNGRIILGSRSDAAAHDLAQTPTDGGVQGSLTGRAASSLFRLIPMAATARIRTSAGVTPGIRRACPTVSGRLRESFSAASRDMPRTEL